MEKYKEIEFFVHFVLLYAHQFHDVCDGLLDFSCVVFFLCIFVHFILHIFFSSQKYTFHNQLNGKIFLVVSCVFVLLLPVPFTSIDCTVFQWFCFPTDKVLRNWHQCDLRVQRERCVVSINLILSRTHENRLPVIRIQSDFRLTHAKLLRCCRLPICKCAKNRASKSIEIKTTADHFPCNSRLLHRRLLRKAVTLRTFTEKVYIFARNLSFKNEIDFEKKFFEKCWAK